VWWPGGLSTMEPFFIDGVMVQPAPAVAGPAAPVGFVNSVPLPTEVSRDPGVIGTNAAMALFFALLFGFTSTVFNSTLKENYACVSGWCQPIVKLFRPIRQALLGSSESGAEEPAAKPGVLHAIADKIPLRRFWQPVTIVLISAVVYGFLDPAFGFSTQGLGLVLSLAIAIAVTTFGYEGLQALLSSRRCGVKANLRLFPAAIAIAIVCVLISRVMAFHPGYVFGIVGGMAFATAAEPDRKSYGRLVLVSAAVLLAVSLVAWFAAIPVTAAVEKSGGFALTTMQSALVGVFVMGLEALLFGLLPIGFMDGEKVMRWSKIAWVFAFGTVAFAFWHVLLNKNSKYLDSLGQRNVQMMFVLLAVYGLMTLAMYLFFRSRNKRLSMAPAMAEAVTAPAPRPAPYVTAAPAPAPEPVVTWAAPAPAPAPAPVIAASVAPMTAGEGPEFAHLAGPVVPEPPVAPIASPPPPAGAAGWCRQCGANVYLTPVWGCPQGHGWDQIERWYDPATGQPMKPYWT